MGEGPTVERALWVSGPRRADRRVCEDEMKADVSEVRWRVREEAHRACPAAARWIGSPLHCCRRRTDRFSDGVANAVQDDSSSITCDSLASNMVAPGHFSALARMNDENCGCPPR